MREKVHQMAKINHLREKYTSKLFILTVSWVFLIIAITVTDGLRWIELGSSELIALITTTTINVLVFFVLVVKYLFQIPKEDKDI